jgi:putative ABC transport system permease protein
MPSRAFAIGFVVIAGVATYVSMRSTMEALQRTLETYYQEYRFADGFASIRRAPELTVARLRAIPGINEIETRVTAPVNLEIPGFDEAVSGQLVSVPEGRQPLLNRLHLRSGRLVQPGREDEVIVNEVFAEAHGLAPGSRITAIINGRRRVLNVAGIALSPEFLIQLQPGTVFPDPQRFGLLWIGRNALAAAYDMEGAFNDVAFTLSPGARIDDVLARIDLVLAPYGGLGAYARKDQASHFYITEEFRQLRGTSTILPVIFLAVAAFLLNIVITRLISLQREQIGVLKAFGYRNVDVGWHYLKLVLVIALAGAFAGAAIGLWLGGLLGRMYLTFYRMPELLYTLRPGVIFAAVLLTTGASVVGVIQAVRRAVRLPPATAMRPAPPPSYRATFVERLGLQRFFDQPTRMILRNLERQRLRALLTTTGIASSCAILIMGLFFTDSFDYIVRVQYGLAQRENLTVTFAQPTSTAALYELASLPGVRYAEPFRAVPVRLRFQHRRHDTAIEGITPDAYLRRLINTQLDPVTIPPDGVVLTERLSEILGAQPGDSITIEVREGARRTRRVPVVALTQQYIGVAAYMDLTALNRLVGVGQAVSGALLMTDERHDEALTRALRRRPRVASIVSQERAIASFYETSARSMLTFTFVLSFFAGIIAFGVVYNSARIALSERDRELASLRVLGFTRGEISFILLGELAVVTIAAIPVGMLAGYAFAGLLVAAFNTELYRFPLVVTASTFAFAGSSVVVAAVLSGLAVRRRLDHLDLVAVLKTRE